MMYLDDTLTEQELRDTAQEQRDIAAQLKLLAEIQALLNS